MSSHEYKSYHDGMDVKAYVDVISVDNKTGATVLSVRKLLTTGVGRNSETSLVSEHTYRRAERGSPQPVWELQATDGSYHAVDSHKVDIEVRQTWVYHSRPIQRRENVAKVKKHYVDVTNMALWRDKMREAQSFIN